MNHGTQEHIVNVIKDVPPVAVGTIVLFGVPLNDWVLILTAIYTVVRIVREIQLWWEKRRNDRNSAVSPRRE